MMKEEGPAGGVEAILAVSGGADSVYLLDMLRKKICRLLVGHYNHGARGKASEADQRFVERLCREWMLPMEVGKPGSDDPAWSFSGVNEGGERSGFEEKAREARYAFLKGLRKRYGAQSILVAHTADDQVETVLMRMLEGAGMSGLKGIPRRNEDGIERPLLDTWRENILDHLRRHKISYRTDKTNFDTRFERNWIRHVLIPLLEGRYGKSVKKRIFALGERFREVDDFLVATARRWVNRNVKPGPGAAASALRLPREPYAKLSSVVRKRIVQVLCFERMKIAPNERLIESMDRVLVSGKPSARLALGKGASLACRYGEAVFRSREVREASEEDAGFEEVVVRELEGKTTSARVRRLAAGARSAVFDADGISGPFAVRPLRAGDRIQPFGASGARKVKEILIDRKVPRDERWGRPVVCDGSGEIVWIPGLVRSNVAPVTRATTRAVVLRTRRPPERR